MSSQISSQNRQDWIMAYKNAHIQLGNTQSVLAFLAKTTSNESGNKLHLDRVEYDGLHILLEYLSRQIDEVLGNNLPMPHTFEALCGKGADND